LWPGQGSNAALHGIAPGRPCTGEMDCTRSMHHLSTRGTAPESLWAVPALETACARDVLTGKSPAQADAHAIFTWLHHPAGAAGGPQKEVDLLRPASLDADRIGEGGTTLSLSPSDEVLPGDRPLIVLGATVGSAFTSLSRALEGGLVPSEVEATDRIRFQLTGVAFQDFVPIRFTARALAPAEGEASGAIVVVKDVNRADVVRFNHFCGKLATALRSFGLKVAPVSKSASGVLLPPLPAPPHREGLLLPADEDEDEDDFTTDDTPVDWAAMLEPLFMEAATSKRAPEREEALQSLARWARSEPTCREALTNALLQHETFVLRTLGAVALGSDAAARVPAMAPMAEAYPLAAILRLVALSPVATARIFAASPSLLAALGRPGMGRGEAVVNSVCERPVLVHREMEQALANLRSSSAGHLSMEN